MGKRSKHNGSGSPAENRVYEFQLLSLKIMYPGATPARIRQLWTLARDKGVEIASLPAASPSLDNLMCSIIRHHETQYDTVLRHELSRDSARGLIHPIVQKRLAEIKGGV